MDTIGEHWYSSTLFHLLANWLKMSVDERPSQHRTDSAAESSQLTQNVPHLQKVKASADIKHRIITKS